MLCIAGPEVKSLGLVLYTMLPGSVEVKEARSGSWAESVGFVGGEKLLEVNAMALAGMGGEEFDEVIRQRPVTFKFRQAKAPSPPSLRPPTAAASPGPTDKLEQELVTLMNMPRGYKYVGNVIAMVRSSLKAAGIKKFGMKWMNMFQVRDGSARMSWSPFHHLCSEMLSLKESDEQLRMFFLSMAEDPSKGIALDELVSFLSDPLERMRKHFRDALSRLTPEKWYEVWQEKPIAWDFGLFLEMCRDNLGLHDPEAHIWLVFRHLAGNDSGTLSSDQIRTYIAGDSRRGSRSSPDLTDELEQELVTLTNMADNYKYIGGVIAMVHSSLKAAGIKKGMTWTSIFQDQDGSGRISWSQFHHLCSETLSLKQSDLELRMFFLSMGEDPSKSVALDELVSFLSDPIKHMRKHFRDGVYRLTPERWREELEESPIAWDFGLFLEMCRDNLGLHDAEAHIWLVFRHLAGEDSATLSRDQISAYVSDDRKCVSRSSIVEPTARRRASSRSSREQVERPARRRSSSGSSRQQAH